MAVDAMTWQDYALDVDMRELRDSLMPTPGGRDALDRFGHTV